MSEQFRLVFAGEINQGQHAAVVKKRLGAVLKLDTERMDVLFSGKSVVVKKVTDIATAARYQAAFKSRTPSGASLCKVRCRYCRLAQTYCPRMSVMNRWKWK